MAKIKVNDKGIARVSLYLNSKNPKDKKIIDKRRLSELFSL